MRHVSGVPFALERSIEAVLLEARAMRSVAPVWLCLDQTADTGCCVGIESTAKMSVESRHGAYRIADQIQVMDMEDRLGEALLLRGGDHQLGRCQPALAVLTTDLGFIDVAGKRSPEYFGQTRDRQQDCERVPV